MMFGKSHNYKKLSDRIGQEVHRQLGDAFSGKAQILESPNEIAFIAGYLRSFTFVAFSELQGCKDSEVHLQQIQYFCEGVLPDRLWDLFQRGEAINQLAEGGDKEEFKQAHDAYELGVSAGIHDVGKFIDGVGRPENLTSFLIRGAVEVPDL